LKRPDGSAPVKGNAEDVTLEDPETREAVGCKTGRGKKGERGTGRGRRSSGECGEGENPRGQKAQESRRPRPELILREARKGERLFSWEEAAEAPVEGREVFERSARAER